MADRGLTHLLINRAEWSTLSKSYQALITAAARDAGMGMTTKYDYLNPPAMRRLLAKGTQLRGFSPEIMDASFKAANETYAEIGAKNTRFKKILDSIMAFRNESYSWWQVAELPFDSFQIKMLGRS